MTSKVSSYGLRFVWVNECIPNTFERAEYLAKYRHKGANNHKKICIILDGIVPAIVRTKAAGYAAIPIDRIQRDGYQHLTWNHLMVIRIAAANASAKDTRVSGIANLAGNGHWSPKQTIAVAHIKKFRNELRSDCKPYNFAREQPIQQLLPDNTSHTLASKKNQS